MWAPIRSRRCFTSGLELSSATRAGVDQRGTLGGERHHGRDRVGDPLATPNAFGRFDRGKVLYPAPEHLGQQVVLRAEVVVSGGRRHAGSTSHVANGEPRVSDLFDLFAGGPNQLHDHLGLTWREPASGGLDPTGAVVEDGAARAHRLAVRVDRSAGIRSCRNVGRAVAHRRELEIGGGGHLSDGW